MFHNQIIDAVQDGKKQFVNTFVTDATVKAELTKLVDAQTKFVKGAVDSSLEISKVMVKSVSQYTPFAKETA